MDQRGGHEPEPDSDKKKRQLLQEQADVVPGTTQHGMQRITQCSFEWISTQTTIRLHVTNRGFDG